MCVCADFFLSLSLSNLWADRSLSVYTDAFNILLHISQ